MTERHLTDFRFVGLETFTFNPPIDGWYKFTVLGNPTALIGNWRAVHGRPFWDQHRSDRLAIDCGVFVFPTGPFRSFNFVVLSTGTWGFADQDPEFPKTTRHEKDIALLLDRGSVVRGYGSPLDVGYMGEHCPKERWLSA